MISEPHEQLLSLMGHDLRNRFAAIQTGLSLLERYTETERSSEMLERIASQVTETIDWVEDLVRVARPSRERPAQTDIVEALDQAVRRTRRSRRRRDQTLCVVLPEAPILVSLERSLLEGLLGLLLTGGGLRATRRGTLRLTLGRGHDSASMRLQVYRPHPLSAVLSELSAPHGLELSLVRDAAARVGGRLIGQDGEGALHTTLHLALPLA